MSAINSDVGICNLALLGHLGQDPITTIGENSRAGELTDQFYISTRDALLRSHPWNFAIAYSPILAADGTYNPPRTAEYSSRFALPTDPYCLKVLQTSIEASGCEHNYRVVGRYIYSNETGFSIEHIMRATAVGEYDPLFIQVLSLDLAILMCMPLADNAALLDRLTQSRRDLGSTAMTMDAQEGKPRKQPDDGWLAARF